MALELGAEMKRGRPPKPPTPWTGERLMERVKIDPVSGCWNWIGGSTNDGYGVLGRGAPTYLAHRLSHTLWVGPIPPGYEIDHLCRNPPCINPKHIEAVTPRVNKMRSKSPWALNAAKTHCKRGHELSEENVYRTKKGRSCRACNLMHGRAFEAKHRERRNKEDRHLVKKDRHNPRRQSAKSLANLPHPIDTAYE